MTESSLDALYLPSRTPLPLAMRASLQAWIAGAVREPPNSVAASLWLGLMSADPVGKIAADYALGWVWLGWRMRGAWDAWQRITPAAGALMPSADYLAWQADWRRLRVLPLYAAPRTLWQSPAALRREARVISYLRGGDAGA